MCLLFQQKFIREGCLQKLSRKGFQQRMFFLVMEPFFYHMSLCQL